MQLINVDTLTAYRNMNPQQADRVIEAIRKGDLNVDLEECLDFDGDLVVDSETYNDIKNFLNR